MHHFRYNFDMRKFILVTAAKSEAGKSDLHGAGIRKLKRGLTIQDFIHDFACKITDQDGKSILHNEDAHILERNGTYTLIYRGPNQVYMWSFTEYKDSDIKLAVSHLTRQELLRDLKELQPLEGLKL